MEEPIQETKLCDNCKKEVSVANFLMHNVYCQRNIVLCVKCQEPFPKNELAEHVTLAHTKFPCPKCNADIEQHETEEHNAERCSKRLIKCEFCDMDVMADGLAEHVDYCGSRTERCDGCGQYVMVKYQAIHQSSNHSFLTLNDEASNKHRTGNSHQFSHGYAGKVNFNNGGSLDKDVLGRYRHNPGKRNNDMPQINVSASGTNAKETAKPKLQGLRSAGQGTMVDSIDQSSVPMEQLDHLIAMQLSEDDQNSLYTNADTETGWPESRPLAPQLPFDDDFDDLEFPSSARMWSPLLSTSTGLQRRNLGSSIYPGIYDTSAAPSIYSMDRRIPEKSEGDTMSLPCEFCSDLFPEDVLLAHQSVCDKNESGDYHGRYSTDIITDRQFTFPGELNNTRSIGNQFRETAPIVNNLVKSSNSERRSSITEDNDQVLIPCEYCNDLFDSDFIIQHESGCDMSTDHVTSPEDVPLAVVPAREPTPPRRPPRSPPKSTIKHQPDPDISYLENLFLKEAIQNSLKDSSDKDNKNKSEVTPPRQQRDVVQNAVTSVPRASPPRSSGATRVRQVPIKVDPNYDQRGRSATSKVEEKDNAAALFKVREAKAAFAGGGPTHGNVYPPLGYDRAASAETTRNSTSASSPAFRRDSGGAYGQREPRKGDTTGARPKSFSGKMFDRTSPDDDGGDDHRFNGSAEACRSVPVRTTNNRRNTVMPRENGHSPVVPNTRRRQDKPTEEPYYLTTDSTMPSRPVPPRRPSNKQNQ